MAIVVMRPGSNQLMSGLMSSASKHRPRTQIMDLTDTSVAVDTPSTFRSNSACVDRQKKEK